MTAQSSDKVAFPGSQGHELAARLDLPNGAPRAFALFAHCFTCTKDVLAASRISRTLAGHGIAVLRFDFTGLGGSDGEFENTNFSSNVDDLVAAADFLRENHQAPDILIGHSLGGAAVLAAAGRIKEATSVVTVNAPCDPGHVANHFTGKADEIEAKGEAEVCLGGRPFTITKQFLDDIADQPMRDAVGGLKKALLVLHAPLDNVVGVENARTIFDAAKHPKSFVSLDQADHMLSDKDDAQFVADMTAAWANRYLAKKEQADAWAAPRAEPKTVVVSESGLGKYAQWVNINGNHVLRADEPVRVGGDDTGPAPYDLLMAGLGACTTMTVRMYAERKKIPLERVSVSLTHKKRPVEDCPDCHTESGKVDWIAREIEIEGDIDEPTRRRMLEIADKCPVHRTLHHEVWVESKLKG